MQPENLEVPEPLPLLPKLELLGRQQCLEAETQDNVVSETCPLPVPGPRISTDDCE